ncbi:MAG: hypothetical protein C4309_12060, partial [Chloroflexota bacterium]
RRYLMRHVWQTEYVGDTRTLDVHIRWVRQIIEENPDKPRYLQTVRGIGYRFNAVVALPPASSLHSSNAASAVATPNVLTSDGP